MKRLANSFAARFSMAGAIASAMLFAYPALAQDSRLSLADRVARLEQQAQNRDQGGTSMVNQVLELQSQVQHLQGQIEVLQHQLQELDDKNKAQYADLDARLARIESGAAGAGVPAASSTAAQAGGPAAAASVAASAPASGQSSAGAAVDPAAAQAAYDAAFQAIRGGDYVKASRGFRDFIQQYPNHALVPNAWYWLGQSYYVTMNYSVALEAFKHLLEQFPQNNKAPDALLKVGYCELELKQTDAAKATLKQVLAKYPGSSAASLAQERLQRVQLQSGN